MKIKIFVILCLILICTPVFAFAATPCNIVKDSQGKVIPPTGSALPQCVNQIYVWSLGVASLLALLMIVIGGYQYMTAAGNADQSKGGLEKIWGAIIGLALLFGAYLLLNTINPDLVDFKTNSINCLDSKNKDKPECKSPADSNTNQQTPRN